ncbi:unnamed protein product [Aphanomyces euteiches]
MARAAGHEVVYTPPHHSDLQPIELIWANVPGHVGRQYDTTTTFADVLTRLEKAFDKLTSHEIYGCILKSEEHLLDLNKFLRATDVQESEDDSADSSGNSSGDEDEQSIDM